MRPRPERVFRRFAAALATGWVFAFAAPIAQAAEMVEVPVTAWRMALPSGDYADLPKLMARTDYSSENDLRSLAFVCDRQGGMPRFFILVISPGFKHDSVITARLTVGDGGPVLGLELRDLYGAPGVDAPKLDWDADILYGEADPEDLSQIAQVKALTLSIADRAWRLPLTDMDRAMPVFLDYCATGKVSDRSVLEK